MKNRRVFIGALVLLGVILLFAYAFLFQEKDRYDWSRDFVLDKEREAVIPSNRCLRNGQVSCRYRNCPAEG